MQAAGENHMGLWGSLMANATVCVHSAGWLEGGLTFGYEKYINDMEALQTIAELCKKPEVGIGGLAWEALADVEPGGHFFGTNHTMERYQTAFYDPLVADLNNYGNWIEGGSVSSDQRATKVWQDAIENVELPANSGDIGERLAPYISLKKAEGGAPPID
jgi:trimethylamine--corrinoid protein Co-methyltransferase